MFVASFTKNALLGGLGDRILGLISVKLLSKLLNKPFYILWDKEDIRKYIDYATYDFEQLTNLSGKAKMYKYIDKPVALKDYLMKSNVFFNDADIHMFYLNNEIAQYLYKNDLFKERNYLEDIFQEYQQLYTHTLKPTQLIQEKIDSYVSGKTNIVGIQMRCGDAHMITNRGEPYNNRGLVANLTIILQNIKTDCDKRYNDGDYHIFITSDYDKVFESASTIWSKEKIIYNHDIIQHIDRRPVQDDTSKIWVDSVLLSQHTSDLYISEESNFGRIAALSAPHYNIYNLQCQPIEKAKILSKHEVLFE
jgi:hypothetical protein